MDSNVYLTEEEAAGLFFMPFKPNAPRENLNTLGIKWLRKKTVM